MTRVIRVIRGSSLYVHPCPFVDTSAHSRTGIAAGIALMPGIPKITDGKTCGPGCDGRGRNKKSPGRGKEALARYIGRFGRMPLGDTYFCGSCTGRAQGW